MWQLLFKLFYLIERMDYSDAILEMYFDLLSMPMFFLFGKKSNNSRKKIDISLFVQKPCLRTKYWESKIEEDFDKGNQNRFQILFDPISIREPASKLYVDKNLKDPSIIKNTSHVDFNDKNLDDVQFVKIPVYQLSENI